MASNKLVRTEQ